MPFLRSFPGTSALPGQPDHPRAIAGLSLLPRCANPRCATARIHLWRSRRLPVFEGQWVCSSACMADLVSRAMRREVEKPRSGSYPHRVPMGLLLLEQGRISPDQLRDALLAQQRAEEQTGGRIPLGQWLLERGVLNEKDLTRALGAQWNCPIFSLRSCRPEEMAMAMPRFFLETSGALPLRLAGEKLLYVAYAGGIDRSLNYALEHMNGISVSAGIARDSEFAAAQAQYQPAPPRFLEAASTGILARVITKLIEAEKPAETRLARVHDCWWLRMWGRPPVHPGVPARGDAGDVLCTVVRNFAD